MFSFPIELLKPKQGGEINKKVIQERQLTQSMLRFTRAYVNEKDEIQRDISTEVYSCVMSESKFYKIFNLVNLSIHKYFSFVQS